MTKFGKSKLWGHPSIFIPSVFGVKEFGSARPPTAALNSGSPEPAALGSMRIRSADAVP